METECILNIVFGMQKHANVHWQYQKWKNMENKR